MNRRAFVAGASALTVAACTSRSGSPVPSPPSPFVRQEVNALAADSEMVASLRAGVGAMRAITDATDPRSWDYWHYSHWMPDGMTPPAAMASVWNQCRHGEAYFYAWHRGFLYFFELMLRQMSGNPKLTLPYWDYYANPNVPAIFTAPTQGDGSANPLYWANRCSTTVTGLVYVAFADFVTTFESSDPDAPTFEAIAELNPHATVHDAVGGDMGRVPTAAADPVFWVHHCNVDRLWSAWMAAGDGRAMPPSGDPYYGKAFAYDTAGQWRTSAAQVVDSSTLGYTYADLALPIEPVGATLPPEPLAKRRGSATGVRRGAAATELGSAGPIALDADGVSVAIPLSAPVDGSQTVTLVLQNVQFAPRAVRCGYSFNTYVNLPPSSSPDDKEPDYYVDSFGPFEMSAEQTMNAGGVVTFTSSMTKQLQLQGGSFGELTIAFVPFGNAAVGSEILLTVDSVSVQTS